MSFIYDDPNLFKQLLRYGSESEKKLSKKGQAAEDPTAGNLRALLNNLRDQITPLREAPTQVGHATGIADLASHNMDSMGDFVDWLSKHGTRIGGSIIVYPGNVERPSKEYGYYKIEPGTEIVVPLARPDRSVVAYWINTNGLKQYLTSLQADPELKTNVMFQVQLLKLIQDANKQLDVDISETYKEPVKVLPDNTEIDRIPQLIDPKQWGQMGTIPLTFGDLKSVDTLVTWLRNNKIALKISDTATATVDEIQSFNLCEVINVLNSRAQAKGRGSQRPEALAYISQITQLASQANCSLTTAPGTATTGPGVSTPGGPSAGVKSAILAELATLRPFNSQYINFQEIEGFLDKYRTLANSPQISDAVNKVKSEISNAKNVLNSPDTPFQMDNLTTTQAELKSRLPIELMNHLYDVISRAGSIYQHFLTQFKNAYDERAWDSMEQQIASGGPQQTNLGTILRVRESLYNKIPQGRR